MVLSRENYVQMYKPEFKVYKWDFSAEPVNFLSIDHSRTVHIVQSSSALFMHIIHITNITTEIILFLFHPV